MTAGARASAPPFRRARWDRSSSETRVARLDRCQEVIGKNYIDLAPDTRETALAMLTRARVEQGRYPALREARAGARHTR